MQENSKLIGIDARFFGEAGPGRYAKAIVEHLEKTDTKNKYKVFLRKKGFEQYKPKNQNFEKVLADYQWYSWAEQTFFLLLLIKSRLDLLYVPHFNIPVLYPGKLVTAIPDIIMHTYSTEKGTTLPKFYFKCKKFVYKFVVFWAVLRSKYVIVPSKAVIQDFLTAFNIFSKNKFVLAYEGVDPVLKKSELDEENVLKKYGISKPYLLYISSMYEHKNVPFLLDAFEILLQNKEFDGQLILVGKKDKFSDEIMSIIYTKGLDQDIIMPGMKNYISDEELVVLRKEALLYVFPSLMEGFSLTPLEAQAVGLPCLISDIDVHREIYSDSVVYFNPKDKEELVKKMSVLIHNSDLRESLVKKGFENIKSFDWHKTAEITLETFTKCLDEEWYKLRMV